MPIRLAVTGITGRMGAEIVKFIIKNQQNHKQNSKIVLGAAIVRSQSPACGIDIGTFVKSDVQGMIITDDIESVKEDFDILIDFTHPNSTMEYLKFCVINGKNVIIGTTGLDSMMLNLIKTASQQIGIVYSANFSVGITVMLQLLKEVARTIGRVVDIDIVDSHHNKKRDIPSGTALMIRDVIESNIAEIDIFQEWEFLYANYHPEVSISNGSLVSNRNIHIHSIRAGDIVGEHAVYFNSIIGERLEIIHKVSNRRIFATGAVYAALWLGKTKIGLFDLYNVLSFKNN